MLTPRGSYCTVLLRALLPRLQHDGHCQRGGTQPRPGRWAVHGSWLLPATLPACPCDVRTPNCNPSAHASPPLLQLKLCSAWCPPRRLAACLTGWSPLASFGACSHARSWAAATTYRPLSCRWVVFVGGWLAPRWEGGREASSGLDRSRASQLLQGCVHDVRFDGWVACLLACCLTCCV